MPVRPAQKETAPPELLRVRGLTTRFFTQDGSLIITSQRYRDQERNKADCLEKLREVILQALAVPKARKKTKPSKGAKRRRLQDKKQRSDVKQNRRRPHED